MAERNTNRRTAVLWGLAVLYAAALVANISFGLAIPIAIVLLISVVFAIVHGAARYGWRGIVTFIVICLVVSNILENTSILTGFPFGHYHYTDALGPKLLLVPLLIGPAYFATGYFSWMIGNVLVGEVRRGSSVFTVVAVPVIASFVMVMWDLTFDPRASTIQQQWIWEQAGGYFGVPLTNYLGWFFTVYVFLQLFALYVRFAPGSQPMARIFPRSHYVQAVAMYAVMGLTPVLTFLLGGANSQVADAAGVVWQTRSIAEAAATVSLSTMVFAAALSAVRLLQSPAAARDRAGDEAAPANLRDPLLAAGNELGDDQAPLGHGLAPRSGDRENAGVYPALIQRHHADGGH
jgi:putative membrane protein